MNTEVLIPGIKFAQKHNLTQKEIEVLFPFFEKQRSNAELGEVLDQNIKTLHHTIQRLKLKQIIVLKERDEKGNNIYELNQEAL